MKALAVGILALGIVVPGLTVAAWARAQDMGGDLAAACRQAGDDDRLQPIPASLVMAVRKLFGIGAMAEADVRRTTVFRCMGGAVTLCNVGANLPCDPANAARHLPGATLWCREHPGTAVIPMAATGHATIYRWRCEGTEARTEGPVERMDARGFIARFWKRLG